MLHTSRLLSYAHLIQASHGARTLMEPQARSIGLNGADSELVLETLHTLGVAEGWRSIGRKMIRTDGLQADPVAATAALGYLYEHSTVYAEENAASLKLRATKPLQVEPKLVFGLASTPEPADSLQQFLQRFDSVALALELLQNPFKGESWTSEDRVCANGFHTKLVLGQPRTLSHKSRAVFDQIISNAVMTLNVVDRDGARIVGFGLGRDYVDQSLQQAYDLHRQRVDLVGQSPFEQGQRIAMGGWLLSQPITLGQEWVVVVSGIDLPSLRVSIA